MVNVEAWVSHLNNPLTLIGFVFVIVASILTLRPSEKLPQKTVPMLFLLAFVIIIGSFGLAYRQIQPQLVSVQVTEKSISVKHDSNKTKAEEKNITAVTTPKVESKTHKQISSIDLHTQGDKSPAVVAPNGNVTINY